MAARASPFGASQIVLNDEVIALIYLGRLDEAREIARELKGRSGPDLRASIEVAAHNWAAVESTAVVDAAAVDLDRRLGGLNHLASAQAARGALAAASATFGRAEAAAHQVSDLQWGEDGARRGRLMLAVASGGAIPLPPDEWARDTSTVTLLTRGLRAAIAGDRIQAQRLLNAARGRPRRELVWQGATPALLEARIEALAGRWRDAARILQPIASQRGEVVWYPAGMWEVRWFLADAFEHLGHADSAAAYLERGLSDPSPGWEETERHGIAWPLAHRRLVLLYARMGRIEDAKRHWQTFAATYRTPDAEVQPLIAEARAALASAEGMAKSARR
jgi:tetratricopeptide (TPR) repeat protein